MEREQLTHVKAFTLEGCEMILIPSDAFRYFKMKFRFRNFIFLRRLTVMCRMRRTLKAPAAVSTSY